MYTIFRPTSTFIQILLLSKPLNNLQELLSKSPIRTQQSRIFYLTASLREFLDENSFTFILIIGPFCKNHVTQDTIIKKGVSDLIKRYHNRSLWKINNVQTGCQFSGQDGGGVYKDSAIEELQQGKLPGARRKMAQMRALVLALAVALQYVQGSSLSEYPGIFNIVSCCVIGLQFIGISVLIQLWSRERYSFMVWSFYLMFSYVICFHMIIAKNSCVQNPKNLQHHRNNLLSLLVHIFYHWQCLFLYYLTSQ